MDTFNHVPANDYSSQNTIIIFKSCLELNFCQAGTSLAVDEGCNGFFFSSPPSPVEECKEGHLSFWKGSLFYKDHNTVCLTRPWPSDYLWCPHYVIHLVWLGEEAEREGEREEGRRKWRWREGGVPQPPHSYCFTVRGHFCWSDSIMLYWTACKQTSTSTFLTEDSQSSTFYLYLISKNVYFLVSGLFGYLNMHLQ